MSISRTRPRVLLATTSLLAIVLVLIAGAAPAAAATGPYVSLGDSYTAAPLVPSPTGNPILCGRSTNNYPSDVARAVAPSSFTDASCSSATTADMTQSQNLFGVQTNPSQFDALKTNDALVTVGIAGNDAGLIGVAEECAELDATHPTGTAARTTTTRAETTRTSQRSTRPVPRWRASSRGSTARPRTPRS
jgi:hypothetical protein